MAAFIDGKGVIPVQPLTPAAPPVEGAIMVGAMELPYHQHEKAILVVGNWAMFSSLS